MERTDRDVDAFIQSLPDDVRPDMATLDAAISSAMEGTGKALYVGKFWGGSDQEIIGYAPYTYRRGKREIDWFVAGLARQKNYFSVYLSAVEDGKYLAEQHGPSLGKVKVGKSSITFARVDDIDLERLTDLVARARSLMTPEPD